MRAGRARRRLVAGLLSGVLLAVGCTAERDAAPDPPAREAVHVLGPQQQAGFTVAAPRPGGALQSFAADVAAIRAAGGTWVRFAIRSVDVITDWDAGPRFDEAALQAVDEAFAFAEDAGLQVYLVTADSYRSTDTGERYRRIMQHYWQVLADRYAHRVSVWQVFNEADGTHFATHRPLSGSGPFGRELSSDYLAELSTVIGLAAATIRAADSRVLVTTNAGGYPFDDAAEKRWMRYFEAVGRPLDVLAVGAYPQLDAELIDEAAGRIGRLTDRFGLPVLIAETGLQTCAGCFSEEQQAEALQAVLGALADSPARLILIYTLRDDGDEAFGIRRADGSPKAGTTGIEEALPGR